MLIVGYWFRDGGCVLLSLAEVMVVDGRVERCCWMEHDCLYSSFVERFGRWSRESRKKRARTMAAERCRESRFRPPRSRFGSNFLCACLRVVIVAVTVILSAVGWRKRSRVMMVGCHGCVSALVVWCCCVFGLKY